MNKEIKWPGFTAIALIIFIVIMAGCGQSKDNKFPPDQNSDKQPAIEASRSNQEEKVTESKDISSNGNKNNGADHIQLDARKDFKARETEEGDIDWQALTVHYSPPDINGLLEAIAESDVADDGTVEITNDIKREFNQMGEDYLFFFMPEVAWYDFESTGAAISYMLFSWTGEFGTFPEKAPQYELEARLRKVFAVPNDEYPRLSHQSYKKYVNFDGESYTLWPESYNADSMIYELVDLRMRKEGKYTYYSAVANEYRFGTYGIDAYEHGENEKLLIEKAKEWNLDFRATLDKLLETGDILKAQKSQVYDIEFRIESDNDLPMIVSVDKK